jgi:membrane AbrB-like protein
MRLRSVLVWCALIAVAAGVAELLSAGGLPAAWLIGPLLVGIVAAVSGLVESSVPRGFFVGAQATIGCLIAQTFTPPVVAQIAHDWWVVLLVVVSTIVAAGIAGWIMARFGSLPAVTAAWGSSPGAAAAMTAMSADYGADPRLVAFMQYLRVTLVVLSAGSVAHFLLPQHVPAPPVGPLVVDPLGWLETLVVALVALTITARLNIPAGPLLGPMLLGAVLHATGLIHIDVPPPVLDAAYVAIGLSIGLRYTRQTVRYALRALPELLFSTGVLIALCCLSAVLLKAVAHVDALTAYLATTPGGLDSVTVIAIGSGADVPLVLAIQAVRLFLVILSGPPLARLIARIA